MNILAYILYLLITWIITVHVGLTFYRNGRVFILALLHGDERLTQFLNKTLLTGYYLLNLGYATVMISGWKTINSLAEVLVSICTMTGKIMCLLGVIHFFNMAVLLIISKRHHHPANNQNIRI